MGIRALKKIYRDKMPVCLRRLLQRVREPSDVKKLRARIIKFYDNENLNPEIKK